MDYDEIYTLYYVYTKSCTTTMRTTYYLEVAAISRASSNAFVDVRRCRLHQRCSKGDVRRAHDKTARGEANDLGQSPLSVLRRERFEDRDALASFACLREREREGGRERGSVSKRGAATACSIDGIATTDDAPAALAPRARQVESCTASMRGRQGARQKTSATQSHRSRRVDAQRG